MAYRQSAKAEGEESTISGIEPQKQSYTTQNPFLRPLNV